MPPTISPPRPTQKQPSQQPESRFCSGCGTAAGSLQVKGPIGALNRVKSVLICCIISQSDTCTSLPKFNILESSLSDRYSAKLAEEMEESAYFALSGLLLPAPLFFNRCGATWCSPRLLG